MASSQQIRRIKSKIPSGKAVPTGFEQFLASRLQISIGWSSLKNYGFTKDAEQNLVPFIGIADGSLVALWFVVSPAAVVYVDSHGEQPRVVAKDFPNFLRSLANSNTGISDLDDDCAGTPIDGFASKPVISGIAKLQKQLNKWAQTQSSLQTPNKTADGEQLRKRIHAIATRMIRDGRCKVYSIWSDWWDMNYQIQRNRKGIAIQYLTFGKWYDVPNTYGLESEVSNLLTMVKNQKRRKYELAVTKSGMVSVDRDRELVLVPPK